MKTHLETISGAKEEGHKCEPDDAGGVHGESDEFGFVEILGDLACFDRVHGARRNQKHVVDEAE